MCFISQSLAIAVAWTTPLSPFVACVAEEQIDLLELAHKATFMLLGATAGEEPCCCGTFISKDLAITVAHGNAGWIRKHNTAKGLRLEDDGTKVYFAFEVAFISDNHEELDLAVLRLGSTEPPLAAHEVLSIPDGPFTIQRGMLVELLCWNIAYSKNEGATGVPSYCRYKGRITSLSPKGFQYDVSPARGDSGGAVFFVQKGILIGMHTEGWNDKSDTEQQEHFDFQIERIFGPSPTAQAGSKRARPSSSGGASASSAGWSSTAPSAKRAKPSDEGGVASTPPGSSISTAMSPAVMSWALRLDRDDVRGAVSRCSASPSASSSSSSSAAGSAEH
jgi:hypothetical protein